MNLAPTFKDCVTSIESAGGMAMQPAPAFAEMALAQVATQRADIESTKSARDPRMITGEALNARLDGVSSLGNLMGREPVLASKAENHGFGIAAAPSPAAGPAPKDPVMNFLTPPTPTAGA